MREPTLAEAGERQALDRIIPRLPVAESAVLGAGDDAAVLVPAARIVATTDVMVEGPDFRVAWSTPHDLGWKAAATNLADVAAMGATPTALLVALAAPPSTRVPVLEAIADGFAAACAALAPGCGVVGGDLTSSPVLTLAVTALGDLEGAAVTRGGARPGDAVAVAGPLGLAGAALRLLFRLAVDEAGEADHEGGARLRAASGPLLAHQLAPSPPIAAGVVARRSGATAMLDVSDGLLLDATRIAEASGVVLDLDATALEPDAAAVRAAAPMLHDDALRLVLTGGEDHALLACFPGGDPPSGFRRIGVVREGEPAVLLDGAAPPSGPAGWDSFV